MINIFVYHDKGTNPLITSQALDALKANLTPNYAVSSITADQLINEPWEKEASLLVLPGGEDRHYMELLNPRGNKKIRKFVESGGSYLGLCAGAYYASRMIEFQVGSPFEVKEERDLCFFGGTARGSVFYWEPNSERGATAASIKFGDQDSIPVYFNGGCEFLEAYKFANVNILARYQNTDTPAIIECSVGNGKAILSGVHLEVDPYELNRLDKNHEQILPSLLLSNNERIEKFRYLLKKLNLQLNSKPVDLHATHTEIYVICNQEKMEEMREITKEIRRERESSFLTPEQALANQETIQFNFERYFKHLQTKHLGRTFFYAETANSTQKALMDNFLHFKDLQSLVYIASRQLKGVGRKNNVWVSPFGCLMFSIQMTSLSGDNLLFLQYLMTIAVIEAIYSKPAYQVLELKIKWPNDIYCKGQKIGGILVQTNAWENKFISVIGVGLNVWNEAPTTCLNKIIQEHNNTTPSAFLKYIDLEELFAEILNQFENYHQVLMNHGFQSFTQQYKTHWLHTDQKVNLLHDELGCVEVIIKGLTKSGFLHAQSVQDGKIFELHPDGNRFDLMKGLIMKTFQEPHFHPLGFHHNHKQ